MIHSHVSTAIAVASQKMRGPIAQSAMATLALRIVNIVLGVVSTIILARSLGADGFGAFSLGFACATLLSGLYQAGTNTHIIKTTASAVERSDWATLNGIRQFSVFSSVIVSAVTYFIVAVCFAFGNTAFENPAFQAVLIGLAATPFLVVDATASALLQGLSKIARAYIPQFIIMQLGFLLLLIFAANNGAISSTMALILFAMSYCLSAIISCYWVIVCWPRQSRATSPAFPAKDWIQKASQILISGMPNIIFGRVEVMLLFFFAGPAAAGVYALAFRFAQFTTLPSFAVGSMLTPTVSKLAAKNNWSVALDRINTATVYSTLLAFAGAVFLTGLCWFVFPYVDPAYRSSAPLVGIISLGYIVQSAAGRPLLLLIVQNKEQSAAVAGAVSIIFGIMIATIATHIAGATGAAIATASAQGGGVLLLCVFLWRHCQMRSDIFYRPAAL